jgi:hypothetical protein
MRRGLLTHGAFGARPAQAASVSLGQFLPRAVEQLSTRL